MAHSEPLLAAEVDSGRGLRLLSLGSHVFDYAPATQRQANFGQTAGEFAEYQSYIY